jgi:uncharacterized membrane protein
MKPGLCLIYALNPLILIEISGNLHFEGIMIFFLLLAYILLIHRKYLFSAIFYGLSIGTKFIPIIFLPFLIKRLGIKKALIYYLITGSTLIVIFIPFLSLEVITNIGSSLDLYFRKFEFNASIYYLIRWLGFQLKGYNMIAQIGPLLAVTTTAAIVIMLIGEKKATIKTLPLVMICGFSIYLFLSTTIHPWYLSLIIAFSIFTKYRFPIVWSLLIFLTYHVYRTPAYHENMVYVFVEYALLWGYLYIELSGQFFSWVTEQKKVLKYRLQHFV